MPGSDVDGDRGGRWAGGRRHFLPKDAAFNSADAASEVEGDRTDGRDLTAEWLGSHPGGTYVEDAAGFAALDTSSAGPVLALFNESHMQYEADREERRRRRALPRRDDTSRRSRSCRATRTASCSSWSPGGSITRTTPEAPAAR